MHVESLSADNDLDELDLSALGEVTILNGFEIMCKQADILVNQVQNCVCSHELSRAHAYQVCITVVSEVSTCCSQAVTTYTHF